MSGYVDAMPEVASAGWTVLTAGCLQIYVPEDPDSESQSVRLTLGELYSTKADRLPPHEREIIIDMQIEKLCDDAVEAIGSSNLQCADPDVGLWHFQNPQRLLASEKDGPGGGSGRSVNSHNTNGSYNTTIDNSNRAVQNFHFYHFVSLPASRALCSRAS